MAIFFNIIAPSMHDRTSLGLLSNTDGTLKEDRRLNKREKTGHFANTSTASDIALLYFQLLLFLPAKNREIFCALNVTE